MRLLQQLIDFFKAMFQWLNLPRLWGIVWRVMLGAVVFFVFVSVLLVFVNPPFSNEMLREKLMGRPVTYEWVPIEKISPHLITAVIIAEDGRYCQHNGIDWRQMEQVWTQAWEGAKKPRGASTITMQTVKNLYLWSDRSYIRKVIELPLAYLIDFTWSKQRQIEIYLNIVEWGPGIYGAKAAARAHFNTVPSRLTKRQAAQMAASLPNPIVRRAGRPGPYTRKMAAIIYKRMGNARPWVSCAFK